MFRQFAAKHVRLCDYACRSLAGNGQSQRVQATAISPETSWHLTKHHDIACIIGCIDTYTHVEFVKVYVGAQLRSRQRIATN